MAQQLRKAGDEVSLLALIDPTTVRNAGQQLTSEVGNSKPQRQSSSERFGPRLVRHLRHLQQLPMESRTAYSRGRFGMMLTLLGNKGKRMICGIYLRLGWSMPPNLRAFFIREILFADIYRTASEAYRPKRYEGRTVLIVAENESGVDLKAIWGALVPNGLTSYAMPGDHAEILQEPLVGLLADHLKNYLDQTQETRLAS